MPKSVRQRLHLAFAVLGWLTNLCMPLAHAAMLADPAAVAAWCGIPSQAIDAKLSQLPAEIREALGKSAAKSSPQTDAGKCCVLSGSPGLLVLPATVALRAAGLEKTPVPASPASSRRSALPPPARGPPALS